MVSKMQYFVTFLELTLKVRENREKEERTQAYKGVLNVNDMTDSFAKINPTDPLRLAKQAA